MLPFDLEVAHHLSSHFSPPSHHSILCCTLRDNIWNTIVLALINVKMETHGIREAVKFNGGNHQELRLHGARHPPTVLKKYRDNNISLLNL